jgi:hypothetical protein
MSIDNLEKVRECCTNPKSFLIIYEGGGTRELPVLVCNYCFENNQIFQKFIKSKEPVTENKIHLKNVLQK